jgi:opacity protein-like surface antigen
MRLQIRNLRFVLALSWLFAPCAFADDPFQADAFLGYSLLRVNSAQQFPSFTANGGVGTLAWNVTNHIGVEAEFGGYYNGNTKYHFDTTGFSYLFGPRVSYGRTRKIDPYGHFLLGGMNASSSIASISVLVPTPNTVLVPSSGRFHASQNNFAMAVGGGVDFKLNKYILVRLAQIDYLYTRFATPAILGNGQGIGPFINSSKNNFRFAVGFVFNFNDDDP